MKRVLITGANSYVGTNVEKWLMREPDKYYVETLDMKDPNWENFDFSKFDVVFHVAGIAHVSTKKGMKDLYFKVNRDLAIETAQKAKENGIKHFIFMSSMIIYGLKNRVITRNTIPRPDNYYGLSKLEADMGIQGVESESFIVSIIRSPFIYGIKSKGNFNKIINSAKHTFILPKIESKRSILYVDNLSIIIEYIIKNEMRGIFFPQNKEKTNVFQIIEDIRKLSKKKTYSFKIVGKLVTGISRIIKPLRKVIDDKYYDVDTEIPFSKELQLIPYYNTLDLIIQLEDINK